MHAHGFFIIWQIIVAGFLMFVGLLIASIPSMLSFRFERFMTRGSIYSTGLQRWIPCLYFFLSSAFAFFFSYYGLMVIFK